MFNCFLGYSLHGTLRPSVLFESFSNPHIESPAKKKIGAYLTKFENSSALLLPNFHLVK